tara:strand:- start:424 stop:609 length:186 start_codon:yes stop_codon:yes gene_type:complete
MRISQLVIPGYKMLVSYLPVIVRRKPKNLFVTSTTLFRRNETLRFTQGDMFAKGFSPSYEA